jgi:ATP-binding cassette subfamily B protein
VSDERDDEVLHIPARRTLGLLVRSAVLADPWRSAAAAGLVVIGQTWPLLAAHGASLAVNAAATGGRGGRLAAIEIALAVLLRLGGRPPLATVDYTLRERTQARIDRRIVDLTCSLPGIDHLEQPALLNRIAHLQRSSGSVAHAVGNALSATAAIVELAFTTVLLAAVHPLVLLLGVAGLVPVATGVVKNRLRIRLDDESGHWWRAKKGLRILAWAPEHGPDLRLAGAAETVRRRQDEAVLALRSAHDRWAVRAGTAQALGDAAFGAALLLAVAFVAHRVADGSAPAGDLVLMLVLGQRVGEQIGQAIERVTNFHQLLRALAALTWLEDTAERSRPAVGAARPPERFRSGISLRGVGFAYPGVGRDVLADIDLDLPVGKRIALVGENGAGKTTLVSLLCGFHQPTAGSITIDDTPLASLDRRAWQARVAAVFQDAPRLEVELVASVGVGDLDDDAQPAPEERVRTAVDTAGLGAVVARFPRGLASRLGRRFRDGEELSGGQWQRVAHARSAVRGGPLLFVLDEPTAALDAEAEHDLFERIRTRPGADRAVTLFVSHRFSTVRDADLIIVLDRGRVVEQGTHEQLLALDGLYADLFSRQARHYA